MPRGKAKGAISEHIKHIFEDGELAEEAVVRLPEQLVLIGYSHAQGLARRAFTPII